MSPATARPRVSIVMPTHNRADSYLPAAIESVLGQGCPRLELIVVDDGSSDRTPELLEELSARDPRLRWQRHENAGHAATINSCFELARGALLGYLNDDDLLLPGGVAALVAELDRRPDAVGAYGRWRLVAEDSGRTLDRIRPPKFSVAEALRTGDPLVGVGALVRADVVADLGGWDERFRWLGDFDFWLRVGRRGPLVRVDREIGAHRLTPGALGNEIGPERARERLDVLDKAFAAEPVTEDVARVRRQAYATALSIEAQRFSRASPDGVRPRYLMFDRFAPRVSSSARLPRRAARLLGRLISRPDGGGG